MEEGIELQKQEKKSGRLEKRKVTDTSKYGSGFHQTSIQERKIKKERPMRMRKLLETQQYSRNLIKRINTWAVNSKYTWVHN